MILKSEPRAAGRSTLRRNRRGGFQSTPGHNAWESDMTAYLIVEHKITDPAKFEEYRTKVGSVIAKHGGRYLTKGGTHKVVETTHWQPDRVAIIEFPDKSALEGWYNSAEVQPLIALRRASVDMDKDMLITIEGV